MKGSSRWAVVMRALCLSEGRQPPLGAKDPLSVPRGPSGSGVGDRSVDFWASSEVWAHWMETLLGMGLHLGHWEAGQG